MLSSVPIVTSASASRSAVGRRGAAQSADAAITRPTPRASITSPTNDMVTTDAGGIPGILSRYVAGVCSGSTPSTVITRTVGPTDAASTTATTAVSASAAPIASAADPTRIFDGGCTPGEATTRSGWAGAPSSAQSTTVPARMRSASSRGTSSGGRVACIASTIGT